MPDAMFSALSAVSELGWWEGVGATALWVARCDWGSAGLSAGVPRLLPAKEDEVSPVPAVGISPRAEVRKEKSSGGQDRRATSGREMESFQKSARGQDHPAWPAGTNSGLRAVAGATPSPFL